MSKKRETPAGTEIPARVFVVSTWHLAEREGTPSTLTAAAALAAATAALLLHFLHALHLLLAALLDLTADLLGVFDQKHVLRLAFGQPSADIFDEVRFQLSFVVLVAGDLEDLTLFRHREVRVVLTDAQLFELAVVLCVLNDKLRHG
jgi:hypothetical protein